jgi:hypothetical protein
VPVDALLVEGNAARRGRPPKGAHREWIFERFEERRI